MVIERWLFVMKRSGLLVLLSLLLAACGPLGLPSPTPDQKAIEDTVRARLVATMTAEVPPVATPDLAATETATQAELTASTTAPVPAATALPTMAPTSTATVAATEPPAPTETPAIATPTPTPLPTATAVPTSEPAQAGATATAAAGPQILFFGVTPTVTLNIGDRLTMEWEAVGDKAELCPIAGPGPVELRCQEVPLAGSTQFVIDEEAMTYTDFGLRVTAGGLFIWSVVKVYPQCQNLRPWFFANPPQRCPADVAHQSYAAGQYFERGLMIWIEDPDDFYVFYRGEDEAGFQTFDWIIDIELKPGASEEHRVGEEPPPGLYEPVSGFGLVWRGEIEGVRADVRERLGWATEPEFGFDTAYQCTTPSYPRMWDCFLRGPRGEILLLHPDSTAQVRWLWQEW